MPGRMLTLACKGKWGECDRLSPFLSFLFKGNIAEPASTIKGKFYKVNLGISFFSIQGRQHHSYILAGMVAMNQLRVQYELGILDTT